MASHKVDVYVTLTVVRKAKVLVKADPTLSENELDIGSINTDSLEWGQLISSDLVSIEINSEYQSEPVI